MPKRDLFMLGVNEHRIIVKGEFAKAVRQAARKSAIPPVSKKKNAAKVDKESGFHFEWK